MTPTPEMIKSAGQNAPKRIERTVLTLRERAAIVAMQGIISNNRYFGSTNQVAETAVRYTDALINELNKD